MDPIKMTHAEYKELKKEFDFWKSKSKERSDWADKALRDGKAVEMYYQLGQYQKICDEYVEPLWNKMMVAVFTD